MAVRIIKMVSTARLRLVIALVLASLTVSYSTMPSDVELVRRFSEDKEILTKLQKELSQEPPRIVGVTRNRVMVDEPFNQVMPIIAGFSSAHFSDYVDLMNDGRISEFWRSNGETVFYITGFGFAGEGWRLCYVFTTAVPPDVVSEIDLKNINRGSKSIYRSLGHNWYIKLIVLN